jgi:uncharacterized membrane-anchored protein
MNPIRTIILFGNLLFVLAFVNLGIWNAEQNIANTPAAYLELYHSYFRYVIEDEAFMSSSERNGNLERAGYLVVRLDEQQVVRYLRFYEGETLEEGEILIKYVSPDGWSPRIGAYGFYIQENIGEIYERATYAEIRILEDRTVLVVGLRGENFELLWPPQQ